MGRHTSEVNNMGWLRDYFTGTPRYKGKNCREWAAELKNCRYSECREAFAVMGVQAAPALIAVFQDAGAGLGSTSRDVAIEILASMAPGVTARLAQECLTHPDPPVRAGCGAALQKIGPASVGPLCEALTGTAAPEPAAVGLVDALRRKAPLPHDTLVWALTQLGAPVIPALLSALTDAASSVRWTALQVLERNATPDVSAALVKVVDDPDDQVAWAAVRLLVRFCPTNDQAARALGDLLATGKPLCTQAAAALVKLGEAAVPLLREQLANRDPSVRARIAAILGELAPKSQQATDALCDALSDSYVTVRRAVVKALAAPGADRPAVLTPLLQVLADDDEQVRATAENALGKVRSPEATAALAEAVATYPDARVRAGAVKALARLALVAPESAASLATDLSELRERIDRLDREKLSAVSEQNWEEASRLRDEADALRKTLPAVALNAAASDHEESVREAAVQAIEQIEQARKAAESRRREEEERARRPAVGADYRCSICSRQAKPVPASSARLLLTTPDELPGLLFQCKSCRRLLCGRCGQRDLGDGCGILDRCPLCQGPIGSVEGAEPAYAARLEPSRERYYDSERSGRREKLLVRLRRIESRINGLSGRAYQQARKDVEEIKRQLDQGIY
jgi:HEAT repeat protein